MDNETRRRQLEEEALRTEDWARLNEIAEELGRISEEEDFEKEEGK